MRGGHETVLLAEDENSVRQATARTLRQLGYRVIEATTSDELLEVWERERASVDLLITDNVMPGEKTGAEMAEHLRQREGDLKVLVMSGYSPEHLRGAAGEDRHVRFLAKPFTAAELAKSVREWLDSQ